MKGKILGFLITLILAGLIFFVGSENRVLGDARELYQVYLDGNKIGLIESKDELLKLIDEEQASIKDEYGVEKVYPPQGLNIEKVYTYDDDIVDINTIYESIKETESFSISGYTVTINYTDETKEPLKLYLLDKDIIKTSLYEIASTFIGEEELTKYEENTQSTITDTGELITSVYFDESITIKEDLISVENKIFSDEVELTQYLLYGTNEEQETYVVQDGEDLNKIAEDHSLNIKELLIANPTITSENILLTAGNVLNVGLINPLVSVTYRKTIVEDVTIPYQTVTVEDNTQYTSYKKTTTAGVDGTSRITEDVKYVNGEIQSLSITKKETIKEAVDEVITKGTKTYSSGGSIWTGPSGVDNSTTGTRNFRWPTETPYVITSYFEYRWGSHHDGLDISGVPDGSNVYSSTAGTVKAVNGSCRSYGGSHLYDSCGGGFGNYVVITTADGKYDITYGHLKYPNVSVGQSVSAGQVIGFMGNSGSSTGRHLHWEMNYAGTQTALNPCKVAFRC